MKILGINNSSHDSSAALVIDGKIIAASEEERFDRVKHSGNFPINAIKFCLKESSLCINDVDEICISMDWLKRAKSRFNNVFLVESLRAC
jgi:carbamoyltransferase